GVETPLTQRIGKYYETHADLLNLLASPIPRMAQPEEIARNVVWLCSDVNGYVTGTLMTIDGGFTAQ
ncbi:MAG: SDR family oxidoreductase, partial [Chloroflexi bacterium]|nr:SDR family oxidoreductase [Chloroflexota bacterium]